MLGNLLIIGGDLKISFTYIGWILSAVILGPFGGAVVGLTTDVLGTFIVPTGGSVNPILTLGYTLYPFIVGVFYKHIPIKNKNLSITLGVIAATLICTLGINSVGLYYMFGYEKSMSFITYVLIKRLWQIPAVGVNLVVTLLLMPVLKKLKLIDKK